MTSIFVLKERAEAERRVAATPETVRALVAEGFQLIVESGAGTGAYFTDEAFQEAGATIASGTDDLSQADVVLCVQAPGDELIGKLKEGAVLIGFLDALRNPKRIEALKKRKVTAFALDMIERGTRAQPLDALTSQATVAGYYGVLLAADRLPKMMPLLMLAAGVVRPAQVIVVGAGVAGLQAIATARRLGAVVEACDVRPKSREEVESLGARFLDVPTDPSLEDRFGYARMVSDEFRDRQRAALMPHVAGADVVIASARVPGKDAPVLITKEMVDAMRPGSVIVELAHEDGGNCEVRPTGDAEEVVTDRGVVVLSPRLIAARAPVHASELYANNVHATIEHLYPLPKTGEAPRDRTAEPIVESDDPLNVTAVVTHAGEITNEAIAALLGVNVSWPAKKESAPATEVSAETTSPSPTKDEETASREADALRNQAAFASDDDEAEAPRRASTRASRRTESSLPEEEATEHATPHPEDEENGDDGGNDKNNDKPESKDS